MEHLYFLLNYIIVIHVTILYGLWVFYWTFSANFIHSFYDDVDVAARIGALKWQNKYTKYTNCKLKDDKLLRNCFENKCCSITRICNNKKKKTQLCV